MIDYFQLLRSLMSFTFCHPDAISFYLGRSDDDFSSQLLFSSHPNCLKMWCFHHNDFKMWCNWLNVVQFTCNHMNERNRANLKTNIFIRPNKKCIYTHTHKTSMLGHMRWCKALVKCLFNISNNFSAIKLTKKRNMGLNNVLLSFSVADVSI